MDSIWLFEKIEDFFGSQRRWTWYLIFLVGRNLGYKEILCQTIISAKGDVEYLGDKLYVEYFGTLLGCIKQMVFTETYSQ